MNFVLTAVVITVVVVGAGLFFVRSQFVSPSDNLDLYIAIKNKRGWDIPGGHVEKDETPLQASSRSPRAGGDVRAWLAQ